MRQKKDKKGGFNTPAGVGDNKEEDLASKVPGYQLARNSPLKQNEGIRSPYTKNRKMSQFE